MRSSAVARIYGFTLIELLTALLILSVLALMSYRGLGAVLDARAHVTGETEKWRRVAAFFARFERDVQLAAPRRVRIASGEAPPWLGRLEPSPDPCLEFSRFGSLEGIDVTRRIAYRLNEKQEIELWLWPSLDIAPAAVPARYVVLAGVTTLDLQYLNADSAWVNVWPTSRLDPPIPQAVRLRIVLASKEELVRVYALKL
ncbi:MAG: type II secretion system minor pseudopilin GspJ [Betaproteobacteria bacterium]|nr:type II secretion system minor pseudopilin GspJ [Betaproteobacteria bacterium]